MKRSVVAIPALLFISSSALAQDCGDATRLPQSQATQSQATQSQTQPGSARDSKPNTQPSIDCSLPPETQRKQANDPAQDSNTNVPTKPAQSRSIRVSPR